MKPSFRAFALAAPILVLVSAGAHAAEKDAKSKERGTGEKVTFTFAPPDGLHYVQTVETLRELATPDGKQQSDRSESKAKVSIRKTAEGFVVTTVPISMTMSRDGESVKDPSLEILDDTVVKLFVSPRGKPIRVEGYEDVGRRVREAYPPEIAAAVGRLLTPESLSARATAEWEGRISDFVGRTVAIGDSWDSAATFTFPNGRRLEYFMRTTVSGRVPCPGKSCVEVRFRYDSDPKAVGELAARVPDGADGGGEEVRAKLASLTGVGIRVVDPSTMTVYSERVGRTMKLTMETKDGALPIVTREEQRYSIAIE
jgi:hypothetical protein